MAPIQGGSHVLQYSTVLVSRMLGVDFFKQNPEMAKLNYCVCVIPCYREVNLPLSCNKMMEMILP